MHNVLLALVSCVAIMGFMGSTIIFLIVIHLSVVFNVVSGQCSWKPECLLFVLIKNMRSSQHNVESDTWMC